MQNDRLKQVLDMTEIELDPVGRLTLESPLSFHFQTDVEGNITRMMVSVQKDFTDMNDDPLFETILDLPVGNC